MRKINCRPPDSPKNQGEVSDRRRAQTAPSPPPGEREARCGAGARLIASHLDGRADQAWASECQRAIFPSPPVGERAGVRGHFLLANSRPGPHPWCMTVPTILCIGTTPAVQRVMIFRKLTLDAVNRAATTLDGAAGKSVNVAKVLHALGGRPVAAGFRVATAGHSSARRLKRGGSRRSSSRWRRGRGSV